MKIRAWSVFGGSRTLPVLRGYAFLSILDILFGFMGPFSAPPVIADRSKIALLRDNWDFDPRKMPSGRGFGKNMKI